MKRELERERVVALGFELGRLVERKRSRMEMSEETGSGERG